MTTSRCRSRVLRDASKRLALLTIRDFAALSYRDAINVMFPATEGWRPLSLAVIDATPCPGQPPTHVLRDTSGRWVLFRPNRSPNGYDLTKPLASERTWTRIPVGQRLAVLTDHTTSGTVAATGDADLVTQAAAGFSMAIRCGGLDGTYGDQLLHGIAARCYRRLNPADRSCVHSCYDRTRPVLPFQDFLTTAPSVASTHIAG